MKKLQAVKTILYLAVWNYFIQGTGDSLHEIAKGWIK